jgi:phosphoglycolate phosphatase-like HAD superfamily hydrolase
VGDKRIDVRTGHNAGALGVLVRTGYGGAEPDPPAAGERPPDQVCESFGAAVEWLLGAAGLERHA